MPGASCWRGFKAVAQGILNKCTGSSCHVEIEQTPL